MAASIPSPTNQGSKVEATASVGAEASQAVSPVLSGDQLSASEQLRAKVAQNMSAPVLARPNVSAVPKEEELQELIEKGGTLTKMHEEFQGNPYFSADGGGLQVAIDMATQAMQRMYSNAALAENRNLVVQTQAKLESTITICEKIINLAKETQKAEINKAIVSYTNAASVAISAGIQWVKSGSETEKGNAEIAAAKAAAEPGLNAIKNAKVAASDAKRLAEHAAAGVAPGAVPTAAQKPAVDTADAAHKAREAAAISKRDLGIREAEKAPRKAQQEQLTKIREFSETFNRILDSSKTGTIHAIDAALGLIRGQTEADQESLRMRKEINDQRINAAQEQAKTLRDAGAEIIHAAREMRQQIAQMGKQ